MRGGQTIRRAQTVLEVAVAFLVMLSLLFGALVIWVWADRQISKRQPPFNNGSEHGRVVSGQPDRTPGHADGDKEYHWGETGGNGTEEKNIVYPAKTLQMDEVEYRAF